MLADCCPPIHSNYSRSRYLHSFHY